MSRSLPNRRQFLQTGSTLLAGIAMTGGLRLALGDAHAASRPKYPLHLGGPVFVKTDDPEELARAHRQAGYAAAYCPNLPLADSGRIRAYADAFARHGVVIAEVGRWVNLLDPNPEKRRQNLQTVTDGLALADAIGARCCVDLAGSFNPVSWHGPHPENLSRRFFDAIVENARKIIDAVKPRRSFLTYEMIGWSLPDGPESYLKLIRAVDRPAFAVHLDPCNVLNSPQKFYRNTDALNECFDKLGRWIKSCHAKDLIIDVEKNLHFREVIPGQGSLDYATYLKRLSALPQQPPLMLEHLSKPEEYDQGRRHIMDVGRRNGIDFS